MVRLYPLLALLVVIALAGAGCYTVLRHPATYDLSQDQHYDGQRACADCHADVELFDYVTAHGASWYRYYPDSWAVYYQSPWWYDDYWYYAPDPSNPPPAEVTGERTLWGRGTGGGPGWLPTQGSDKGSSALPQVKPQRNDTQNDDKPNQDKPKKKKKKRTLWGR